MDDDDINFDWEQCDDNEDRDLDWGFERHGRQRIQEASQRDGSLPELL
jgi:hypothetical protein